MNCVIGEIMNLYEFILVIKVRPGMYFGNNITINNIGFFINGFLCGKSVSKLDSFDVFFKDEFPRFVRKSLGIELTEFEFWFETIDRYANDSDGAINIFFMLFDDFYALYERINKAK